MPQPKRRRKPPKPEKVVVKRLPGNEHAKPRVGQLPPEEAGQFDPEHFRVRRVDHESAERHRQRILALPPGATVNVEGVGSMAGLIWRVEDVNGQTDEVTVVTTLFGVREERRTVPIDRVSTTPVPEKYFSS